jgi:hypothetical protein
MWKKYFDPVTCYWWCNLIKAIVLVILAAIEWHKWPVTKVNMAWFAFCCVTAVYQFTIAEDKVYAKTR